MPHAMLTPDLHGRASRTDRPRAPQVLIVEDEFLIALALKLDLQRGGYGVTHAADGVHALRILEENDVDAVVTDLRMPRLGGLGLARALRARGELLPIIVVTASVDAAICGELGRLGIGAADILQKPCSHERVLRALAGRLGPVRAGV